MRDLVGRIAGLEIAHEAIEQGGRNSDIAFRGEPVADIADMAVDAENLLRDHHRALRLAGRIGAIGAERMIVGGGERKMLAQYLLPKSLCVTLNQPWPAAAAT